MTQAASAVVNFSDNTQHRVGFIMAGATVAVPNKAGIVMTTLRLEPDGMFVTFRAIEDFTADV